MRMRSSTGAATRSVRSDIARKPANRAASASERPSAKRPRARDPGESGEDRDQPGRQPENRLAVGREVERDAAHRRNGKPEEEPPLLDFARQRAREGLAPVRRVGGRARKAGGRRQNACARGS